MILWFAFDPSIKVNKRLTPKVLICISSPTNMPRNETNFFNQRPSESWVWWTHNSSPLPFRCNGRATYTSVVSIVKFLFIFLLSTLTWLFLVEFLSVWKGERRNLSLLFFEKKETRPKIDVWINGQHQTHVSPLAHKTGVIPF